MSRPLFFLLLALVSSRAAEILPAGGVAFSLKAPQAEQVALVGQWTKEKMPLDRDADGLWQVTLTDIPPGVWEYSFAVDGLNVIDPENPHLKPQRRPAKSILHLPSSPPAPWDWQDIPHGTLHLHPYQSRSLGQPRELVVYTPPGYESATGPLPLLVLQHGSGDNQRAWTEHGKAHWILDHLLATKAARPMIVLMLDGHPLGMVPRDDPAKRAASLEAFRRDLFEDALPLVEAIYRVSPLSSDRAIAGLSMGGWQSLTVGLNALDRFGWVASFSGAADPAVLTAPLAAPESTNDRLKLLWIACGRDDFLLPQNEQLIGALQAAGIRHEWRLTEGDHSWPVWRGYLAELVPRLFQP